MDNIREILQLLSEVLIFLLQEGKESVVGSGLCGREDSFVVGDRRSRTESFCWIEVRLLVVVFCNIDSAQLIVVGIADVGFGCVKGSVAS